MESTRWFLAKELSDKFENQEKEIKELRKKNKALEEENKKQKNFEERFNILKNNRWNGLEEFQKQKEEIRKKIIFSHQEIKTENDKLKKETKTLREEKKKLEQKLNFLENKTNNEIILSKKNFSIIILSIFIFVYLLNNLKRKNIQKNKN